MSDSKNPRGVKFYKCHYKDFINVKENNKIDKNGLYFIIDKKEIYLGDILMANNSKIESKEFKILYDSGL